MHTKVFRGLSIRHASLFDQPHSLKLELASKLPSLHDTPPVPSKHLTRCLRNRQQANATRLPEVLDRAARRTKRIHLAHQRTPFAKVFRKAERVRCPRAGRYGLLPGGLGIILPALRPAREVLHWTGTGFGAGIMPAETARGLSPPGWGELSKI